jgi:hypothetical protein
MRLMSCYRTTGRRLSVARCDGRTLTQKVTAEGVEMKIEVLAVQKAKEDRYKPS